MRPDDLQKIFEKDCATKDIHLLDPIGHGTFADVYLYEMRDPDGLFIEDGALKIIDIDKNYKNDYYANPAIGGTPLYYINKCHREYNHVSKLFKECTPEELTHIVPIKSCQLLEYHDIHLLLLFMPYYPQHLENRQHVVSNYNEDDILDIAIQCAEGLRTLHEHQMIHKDIKPNNIFMGNESGKVIYRIGDFGCSRDTTTNNLETSTPLGTLYYAAPEAFFGEYYFSSDIYSLGILIYWLCNNYNYPDELSILQHAEVTIPRMENGSDRLWHIVQKATQHHYQNRYQNAAELLDALYPLQQAQKETIPETDNHQEDILQTSIGFKEDRSFVNYEQTFAYYGEKAVNNDCEAMRELAFMYYYGFGVEQDEEQCLALLRSACEDLQDTQAAFELAKIYDFGQEKLRNKQKALEYYETAAYQGCIEAFYFLSHCYTDKEKALELLTTGAQKGDPKAKFTLAAIYQGKIKDFKIKTDIQKAVMIYEELSEGGHLEARKELAEIYIQNHQSEKGMALLKEAANSNLMEACLSLGEIYENGRGVLADYDLAKFYYEKAQKIFFDQEINNVGKFYVNGRYIFLNYAQAKDYYLKHNERKDPYSTYMLAIMNTYHLAMRLNHMQARKMFNEVITGTDQISEITEKASAFLGYFDEMGYGSTSRNLEQAKQHYFDHAFDTCLHYLKPFQSLMLLPEKKSEIEKRRGSGAVQRGNLAKEKNQIEEAIKFFDMAAQLGNSQGMFELANIYSDQQRNQEAMDLYRKSAEAGNAEAMCRLGQIYFDSHDHNTALEWYTQASELNHAEAMYKLGSMYYHDDTIPADPDKAIEWITQAAKAEYPAAMNDLGYLYNNGKIVEQNHELALEWYMKAAKAGYTEAMNNLGYIYKHGHGTQRDDHQAFEWYRKAAEAGYSSAMNHLANMYEYGEGTKKDDDKAFQWYLKAAKADFPAAMHNLGYMYEHGLGTQKDDHQAFEWHTRAAEAGLPAAMNHLGDMYYDKKDDHQAFEWYMKAAEAGFPEAMNNLGYMYHFGQGTKQDYNKALEWYTKGAEIGHVTAMYNLGCMYESFLAENQHLAIEWYTKAAEKNDSDAMYRLGEIYNYGLANAKIGRSFNLATEWYIKAAEKNHEQAKQKLLDYDIFDINKLNQEHYLKIMAWYASAANKGNTEVMIKLGDIYSSSLLKHDRDYDKAIEWCLKAAKNTHPKAMEELKKICRFADDLSEDSYKHLVEFCKELMKKGNAQAFLMLGIIYEAKDDYNSAISCYQKLALSGNAEAMSKLGDMFYHGFGASLFKNIFKYEDHPGIKNYKIAIQWYTKAAKKGNTYAMYMLEKIYSEGKVVPKNDMKAAKWRLMWHVTHKIKPKN